MKHFTVTKNLGKLKPYNKWLRYKFPSWLAFLIATPLLIIAYLSIKIESIVFAFFFAASGLLFLSLWFASRKSVSGSGLLFIDNKSNSVEFINNDGSKTSIALGCFTSIKIEKLIYPRGYSWRATLFGSNEAVVLEMGMTKNALVRWVQPVSDWLQIPVEFPNKTVDGLLWSLTTNRRGNPYPIKL